MFPDHAIERAEMVYKPALESMARALVRLPGAVVLMASGLAMTAIYYFGFAQRYSLAEYGDRPFQTIASLNNLSVSGAFLYVFGFIALFGLYWLGLRRGLRAPTQHQWIVVAGFAVVFSLALLPMYPADAADVYDYALRGRMTTLYGLNPMRDLPTEVRSDPFYSFSSLRQQPSAYGPAWEALAALASRIAGDDRNTNVIVFKFISVVGYGLIGLLVGLTLRRVAPRRTLTGVYLFLWNPLAVYMTAGNGHNDTIMMLFVVLGFYCLARRWYVGATCSMILGGLVKFVPFVLVPIIAVIALRELGGTQRLRYVLRAAAGSLLLVVLLYAPFWFGPQMLVGSFGYRTRMFTGSVATVARMALGPVLDGKVGEAAQTPVAASVVQYAALALFGLFYASQLVAASRSRDWPAQVRVATSVLFFYILVTTTWFQPWYALWPLACAALFDNSPTRRLILYFSYLVTWQPFLYYYITLRAGEWAAQPWRDLLPISVVMGIAWGYIAWFWLSTWLRSAARTPFSIQVGQRLRTARERLCLSPSDVADELDLRTDDVLGYERGDRSVPLTTAQTLSQFLRLRLPELIGSPSGD